MSIDDYFDKDFAERLKKSLPEGHPALEKGRLTLFQGVAFPILIWFFDQHRSIGTGRTTLMAHVIIELAMRGNTIEVDDYSQALLGGSRDKARRGKYFFEHLVKIINDEYRSHLFEFNLLDRTIKYKGRRPK